MAAPRLEAAWPSASPTASQLASEQALLDDAATTVPDDDDGDDDAPLRQHLLNIPARRRSSVASRLAAVADLGGPNSFRSFARSWQRAASFADLVPPRPRSLVLEAPPPPPTLAWARQPPPPPPAGLLTQHLGAATTTTAADDSDDLVPRHGYGSLDRSSPSPRPASPSSSALAPADNLSGSHPPASRLGAGAKPLPARLLGQSTLPQSVFNSLNIIIGAGLLSLPLAVRLSGWLLGIAMLNLAALITAHTGKLLGRCIQAYPSLVTYSDVAFVAFGPRARLLVSALFTLELVAVCVALFILFADSLHLLFPTYGSTALWKSLCALVVLGLNCLPLHWLSYSSVVGIFSTIGIICIIIIDGLVKEQAPGSLRQPARTYLLPSNWLSLPIAYGLFLSPWGAHSVFPSIYRDMRHPHKWNQAVNITFSLSYSLDLCLAVVGVVMFGDGILNTITSNILGTPGYPEFLTMLMCIFIAIIPLTKIPLNARPLVTMADLLCGLQPGPRRPSAASTSSASSVPSPSLVATTRASALGGLVRLLVVTLLLAISVLFPAFDSVCAFLGAALCTFISIVLPIAFYLKLFWPSVSLPERLLYLFLLVAFTLMGLVSTAWTLLPKHMVGIASPASS